MFLSRRQPPSALQWFPRTRGGVSSKGALSVAIIRFPRTSGGISTAGDMFRSTRYLPCARRESLCQHPRRYLNVFPALAGVFIDIRTFNLAFCQKLAFSKGLHEIGGLVLQCGRFRAFGPSLKLSSYYNYKKIKKI